MGRQLSASSSRRLALLFLVVVAPPAIALVWLGLQLMEQDRSVWMQRELQDHQIAAQDAIRSLEQSLAEAERFPAAELPEGMVRFTLSPNEVIAEPAGRVLWLPVIPESEEAEAAPFADAERLEYQGDADSALLTYRKLVTSQRPAVRAGALLRLARVHRRAKRWAEALAAYRQLSKVDGVTVEGMPAGLVARRAICTILEDAVRNEELSGEAASLKADFLAGEWALDQPGWELTARQLEEWTGQSLSFPPEAKELSEAADWLWEYRQRNGSQPVPTASSSLVRRETTLLRLSDDKVLAITQAALRYWTEHAAVDTRLSLVTDTGNVLAGAAPESGPTVVTRTSSETGLPWTLVLGPGDSSSQPAGLARRRRLMSLGLAAIVLLLSGGSYFLWRVIQRELAVVRLQTDFVAAVSHEFRTPLASLRHVTELMQEDDDLSLERRRSFYELLGRNTERLQRLVESLLDFARIEGGRKQYSFEELDAGKLVSHVIADFRKEVEPKGFTVHLDMEMPDGLGLRADAASLTNALWNVLDNAVKYSGEGTAIHVCVERKPGGVAISVRDEGLGVPRDERKEIFRRFVRGENVNRLGIKGTGLGLAMVSQIVQAHGGTVELESEEGTGSTFRLMLPAQR